MPTTTTLIDPVDILLELDKLKFRLNGTDEAIDDLPDRIDAMVNAIKARPEIGLSFLRFWITMARGFVEAADDANSVLGIYSVDHVMSVTAAYKTASLAATMALVMTDIGYAIREKHELDRIMSLMPNMVQGKDDDEV